MLVISVMLIAIGAIMSYLAEPSYFKCKYCPKLDVENKRQFYCGVVLVIGGCWIVLFYGLIYL